MFHDLVSKGTKLFLAKTIIHETMHAYIGYVRRTEPSSDFAMDIAALYRSYKNAGKEDVVSANMTEHEFMSQFVNAMAFSLSIYDGHRLPMDYYVKISWGGLETSSAYQALSNKTEIQNIIKAERYGYSSAQGIKCN